MTRGIPNPWTPERIAEAKRRHARGEPISALSAAMGVGKTSVRKVLGIEPGDKPSMREKMGFVRPDSRVKFNDNEDRYIRLRQNGKSEPEARDTLGVSHRQAERYEIAYRTQTFRQLAYANDGSMPKFARHEEHLAAIKRYVGFDAVSRLMMRRVGA